MECNTYILAIEIPVHTSLHAEFIRVSKCEPPFHLRIYNDSTFVFGDASSTSVLFENKFNGYPVLCGNLYTLIDPLELPFGPRLTLYSSSKTSAILSPLRSMLERPTVSLSLRKVDVASAKRHL